MPVKGSRTPAAVRLASHIVQSTDGCLLWVGALSTQGGYACLVDDDGRMNYAHRVAWELANGMSIPDTMQIHHVCKTRTCCNPDHLILVSRERHLELEREERAARNALARPLIRNLFGMGRTPAQIKAATGATLGYIRSLLKSDAKLAKSAPVQAVAA